VKDKGTVALEDGAVCRLYESGLGAGVEAARSDELAGRGPLALSAGGVDVVVLRTGAGLRAFQGRCPHQGALLGEGEIEGGALVCRNHRWRFDADSGRRLDGPECLASYGVIEHNGTVFVDVGRALSQAPPRPAAPRRVEDLPGPWPLPLIGNLLQLDLGRLHEILEDWARQYGPVYTYRMGRTPVVAISAPVLSEQVLRARPETFRRLRNVQPVFKEAGVDGVFSAEGEEWRAQRRLVMEALSYRQLRRFYPSLKMIAGRLRERWLRAGGAPLDIVEELKRFTVDVTTLLTFGHDVNTIEQSGDLIQRRLELIFPAFNRRLFSLVPTWRLVRGPADRRLDRAVAELQAWLAWLIDGARARQAADPTAAAAPANLLEAMLAARDRGGRPFPDAVVMGNLMTMLLGGEDTTAFTLAWAVHHLCDHPEAVAALRAEADAAFAGPSSVPEDIEAANHLAYAAAVANEAMRLRPVAPLIFLEAKVDTVVGDLLIPAGTPVVTLTRPPVRDPRNFADPLAFRPQRWLGQDEGAHESHAHMPFGGGPRLCPGRTLALLEMKVLLAMLYGTFDVERDGHADDVRERYAFTMLPEGLRVRLRPRGDDAYASSVSPAQARTTT
jgi:cytochrome P450/nitrite reductase/ring-hydroxylating ferredoxin subunit